MSTCGFSHFAPAHEIGDVLSLAGFSDVSGKSGPNDLQISCERERQRSPTEAPNDGARQHSSWLNRAPDRLLHLFVGRPTVTSTHLSEIMPYASIAQRPDRNASRISSRANVTWGSTGPTGSNTSRNSRSVTNCGALINGSGSTPA